MFSPRITEWGDLRRGFKMARKTTVKKNRETSEQVFEQLGVRIPRDLINRLRIAAATRKARRAKPHSQAEMVADALTEWLDRKGH